MSARRYLRILEDFKKGNLAAVECRVVRSRLLPTEPATLRSYDIPAALFTGGPSKAIAHTMRPTRKEVR